MGRTLGPFTDVSTARVDGAYEIYEGADEEGREIEILTLGISSSKDPSRRALLSDTVAWAHATRGPADAPILQADLNSEQPYVVTLRQTGYRGVERMLERMLAMGPPTGPLMVAAGAHTGQMPRIGHHTNPHGIPPVVSTPPAGSPIAPASPMTPYVTTARRSRPAWLIPLVIVLSLVVLGGGSAVVLYGMTDSGSTAAGEPGDTSSQPDEHGDASASPSPEPSPQPDKPEWTPGLPPQQLVGANFGPDEGHVNATPGWPFAFRIPQGWECQNPSEDESADELICQLARGDENGERAMVVLQLKNCPGDCTDGDQAFLEGEWAQRQTIETGQDTRFYEDAKNSMYTLSMSHFFTPRQNTDRYAPRVQLVVNAIGPFEDTPELQMIVNEILTQANLPS